MQKADTMRAVTLLGLARRLLTHEAADSLGQEYRLEAAGAACEKLRIYLSKLIGQEGFRTLLVRALTLTTVQFPRLSAVHVGADGSLAGLRVAAGIDSQEPQDDTAREDTVEGAVALVAHLLALLVTFIGEDLTRRILGTVWPDFALDDAPDLENDRP